MDTRPTHPWYRLHIVTCLLLLYVAVAFTGCQISALSRNYHGFGWPIEYLDYSNFWDTDFDPLVLSFNILAGCVLLCFTGVGVEQFIRRFRWPFQFSLSATLTSVTTLALLLGDYFGPFNLYDVAQSSGFQPRDVSHQPWFIMVPIYFAIFCTIYCCCWEAIRVISRTIRRVARDASSRD